MVQEQRHHAGHRQPGLFVHRRAVASLSGMASTRREPPHSSGRALISGGIGLLIFAAFAAVLWATEGHDATTWRSALMPLVAISGPPLGIVFIVVGVAKVRRGLR